MRTLIMLWALFPARAAVREIPHGMEVSSGKAVVRVTALSPTVLRVRYSQDGAFPPDRSWAVLPDAFPNPPKTQVQGATLDAGVVKARVSGTSVEFLDENGSVISRDLADRPIEFHDGSFKIWKSMPPDERYFGLGDKSGPLDRRNQAYTCWTWDTFLWQESTDPMYKCVPFFLAMREGKSYGIFLDDTYRSFFDFGKEARDAYAFGAEDGTPDYYFFYGPRPKKVVESFTELVGRTPLPPLWSLGYQQSRQNYDTEAQYRGLASEFRKRRIPADVLYMDGGYTIGDRSFTLDLKRFPTLPSMIKDLGEQGFKVVTSAYFTIQVYHGDRAYESGMASGHFVRRPNGDVHVGRSWPGDTVYPDFARERTRRWWGGLYDDFLNAGIRGIWNDMNEPAVEDSDLPLDTVYDADGRRTDHREMHNVYGMLENKAVYEGMLRLKPDLRPFLLTRAGFAGTHRYAATWTGDNTSSWNHMRISVPQLLNLGLSGFALSGADIGGFCGLDSGPSPELMTRWMQLGAFNPLFRNHASSPTRDREPWQDGAQHEALRRAAIEARYRLMPYIYTRMEENSRTGVPLMRPMFLEFPDEKKLVPNADQYMFGDKLLVAPKVWDIVGHYPVPLPPGGWYDYWTGAKVNGAELSLDPPLGTIPVYVRAGSVLPRQPVIQHTGETPQGPLELLVYPGRDCGGDLYIDDGETFAFKRGELLRARFSCEDRPDRLVLRLPKPEGSYKPWFKQVRVTVFGIPSVQAVLKEGKPLPGWKAAEGSVVLPDLPWPSEAQELAVIY